MEAFLLDSLRACQFHVVFLPFPRSGYPFQTWFSVDYDPFALILHKSKGEASDEGQREYSD